MMNDPHQEPVVCPECSELVIVCVFGGTSLVPATVVIPVHPDLSWPDRNCASSSRLIAAAKIVH